MFRKQRRRNRTPAANMRRCFAPLCALAHPEIDIFIGRVLAGIFEQAGAREGERLSLLQDGIGKFASYVRSRTDRRDTPQ